MSEWKEYKLGDVLLSANTGLDAIKRAPIVSINTGIKCLRIQDVSQDKKYNDWGFTQVLENNFEKFKLLKNDIIVARTGATVGVNLIINSNLNSVFNNGLIRLRVKDDFDSVYISYLLRSSSYWNHINSIAFGTTSQPNIQINQLLDYRIKVPNSKSTQTAIAEVLSSLDDKIALNNKINQELETLAHTLFKQWFIDFEFPNENGEPYKSSGGEMVDSELGEIPRGWEVTKVATLDFKLQTGTRPKGGVGGITSGTPSVGAESVKGLGYYDFSKIKYVSNEFASKMNRGKVEGYELLIYKDGGKPGTFIPHFTMFGEGFPFESFFINEHVFLLDFFDKKFNSFCYFFFDSEYVKPVFENNGGKAAIPGINQEDVKNLLIFKPDNEMVKLFGEFAKSSITTILKNCNENTHLSNLRDELLPKLISGELEINEITN